MMAYRVYGYRDISLPDQPLLPVLGQVDHAEMQKRGDGYLQPRYRIYEYTLPNFITAAEYFADPKWVVHFLEHAVDPGWSKAIWDTLRMIYGYDKRGVEGAHNHVYLPKDWTETVFDRGVAVLDGVVDVKSIFVMKLDGVHETDSGGSGMAVWSTGGTHQAKGCLAWRKNPWTEEVEGWATGRVMRTAEALAAARRERFLEARKAASYRAKVNAAADDIFAAADFS